MTRLLVAAALVTAAFAPAAHAATQAGCDFGPQIGTACVRNPKVATLDLVCPIAEGQPFFGIKCAPY